MKAITKYLSIFAATSIAFVGSAFAQLVTYETQSTYQGSVFTFSASSSQGQTFTNVSAVASMTYNIFAGSGYSGASGSFSAVFGEWTGSAFVGGTTVDFGTINVPAVGPGWTTLTNSFSTYNTYEVTFDLTTLSSTYSSLIHETYGYLTSASNTYALMLTDLTGTNTGLGLGLTNTNSFAYGATSFGFNDWTFDQIVVAPGSQVLVPVPEAGTVASIIGGVFVAGLMGLRLRQKRRQATLAAAAA